MSGTDPFALQQSGLNEFLFAEIGTEPNGMPLSLLSALARVGKDPWQEAQRLAELPGHLAVSGLAGLIATASAHPVPEATTIAQRLVKLLPGRSGKPAEGPGPAAAAKTRRLLPYTAALVGIALTTAVLLSASLQHRPPAAGPSLEQPHPLPRGSQPPGGAVPVPTSD